jgi:hypothetical protein
MRKGFFVKRRTRYCRICGQQFRPVRLDAMTCSTTCRIRKSRNPDLDLAYLATLPADQARSRRFIHETDVDAIAIARMVCASRREGRRDRRGMPKVARMHVRPTRSSRS